MPERSKVKTIITVAAIMLTINVLVPQAFRLVVPREHMAWVGGAVVGFTAVLVPFLYNVMTGQVKSRAKGPKPE